MSVLLTGAPHFKSVMTQHRHANYTLAKVLNELVDNVIKKASQIRVYTEIDDSGSLQELRVSDNYLIGFENLDRNGAENPFNMGHIRSAHSDDYETSEFGVGMKAGALSAANQLNVYTRMADPTGGDDHKYIEVICDFIRMSKEPDVNASYNPRIKLITREEYKENHPFDQGSTLKLSKIRDCIYPRTTLEKITADVSSELSSTYTRFIARGSVITVNDNPVDPIYDFFEDPKCTPFTIVKEMFILEKPGSRQYFIRKHKERVIWQEYNPALNAWTELKTQLADGLAHIQDLQSKGYESAYGQGFSEDGTVLQLNTTFVFCSDKFHNANEFECPEDAVLIYKDDRNYGKQSLFRHNNGHHNYTLHEIEFDSKRLGKDVGITFNKEILMNGKNELIMAIKAALMDSKKEFTADTGTLKYLALFEYAMKHKLIDPKTCPLGKLPQRMRPPKPEDSSSDGDKPSAKKALKEPTVAKALKEPTAKALKEPTAKALKEPTVKALKEPTVKALKEPTAKVLKEPINALKEPTGNALKTPVETQNISAEQSEPKSPMTTINQWFPKEVQIGVANESDSSEPKECSFPLETDAKLFASTEDVPSSSDDPIESPVISQNPATETIEVFSNNKNKTMRIIDLLANTILENALLSDEILIHIESLILPNHCENAESANH